MGVARFNGAAFKAAREQAGLTRAHVADAHALASADRVRIWEEQVEQPKAAMVPKLAGLVGLDPPTLPTGGVGQPPCLSALRLAAGLSRSEMVAAAAT